MPLSSNRSYYSSQPVSQTKYAYVRENNWARKCVYNVDLFHTSECGQRGSYACTGKCTVTYYCLHRHTKSRIYTNISNKSMCAENFFLRFCIPKFSFILCLSNWLLLWFCHTTQMKARLSYTMFSPKNLYIWCKSASWLWLWFHDVYIFGAHKREKKKENEGVQQNECESMKRHLNRWGSCLATSIFEILTWTIHIQDKCAITTNS